MDGHPVKLCGTGHCAPGTRTVTDRQVFTPWDTPIMSSLKLVAFDAEDLAVVSAHLEESTLTRADMAFLPKAQRFALVAKRRDRESASAPHHLTGLHFERVTRVQTLGMKPDATTALTLIGLGFALTDDPAGQVSLLFDGGMAIKLDVECLEAQMADLADLEGTP